MEKICLREFVVRNKEERLNVHPDH
uniref:Uncharacterized protein n=1 Tax=Arundo donax TaxID=35708 RepID=A0A0A8ZGE3_ARUDO